MTFLEKQKEFIKQPLARHNYLSGSVRSGKSFVANIKIITEVAKMDITERGIIVGNTLDSLETNVLKPMLDLIGTNNLVWSKSARKGYLFGREFVLRSANNIKSENSIRGSEFKWAYCDEVTLYPENFYSMLLTRLSRPKSWVICTCNPDNPDHYIKKNYIDNEKIDVNSWTFVLTDNDFLDADYIKSVENEYQGVFYQRFILGRWVRAEGSIYQCYLDNKDFYKLENYNEKYLYVNIGVDYGANNSMTSMTCTGITKNFKELHALADDNFDGIKEPSVLYKKIEDFYLRCRDIYGKIDNIYCDYGALGQVLTLGLKNYFMKKHYPVRVKDCLKGKINDRIQLTLRLMGTNRFKMSNCPKLDRAFERAVWEDDKEERKDDETTKIDPLDSFEYSFYAYYKYLERSNL